MSVYDLPGNERRGTASYVNPTPPRGVDGRFQNGPIGFQWQGIAAYTDKLNDGIQKMDEARLSGANRLAEDVLSYARINAPWEDRTGELRATLMTQVNDDPVGHITTVYLGYSLFYGEFIESGTKHAKSYAIIGPTLEAFASHLQDYI